MITAKSESKIAIKFFNSCNELINHYKNNEISIRIYGMETKFKLGTVDLQLVILKWYIYMTSSMFQ